MFKVDISELPTEIKLVPENTYETIIKKAVYATGVKNDKTWGRIDLTLAYLSSEIKDLLKMPEPSIRHGIMISFDDKGDFAMGGNNNVQLGKLLESLDLRTKEANEDFLANTDVSDDKDEQYKIYFGNMCSALTGRNLEIEVGKRAGYTDKTQLENYIKRILFAKD